MGGKNKSELPCSLRYALSSRAAERTRMERDKHRNRSSQNRRNGVRIIHARVFRFVRRLNARTFEHVDADGRNEPVARDVDDVTFWNAAVFL